MPPPLPHLAVLARPTSKNFGCVMLTIAFVTQKFFFMITKNFIEIFSANECQMCTTLLSLPLLLQDSNNTNPSNIFSAGRKPTLQKM